MRNKVDKTNQTNSEDNANPFFNHKLKLRLDFFQLEIELNL